MILLLSYNNFPDIVFLQDHKSMGLALGNFAIKRDTFMDKITKYSTVQNDKN